MGSGRSGGGAMTSTSEGGGADVTILSGPYGNPCRSAPDYDIHHSLFPLSSRVGRCTLNSRVEPNLIFLAPAAMVVH